jgi:hypothetical protein
MRSTDYPELGVVKTATPCSADWDEMRGDEVKRFCAKCRLYVYDFSAMTTAEARALIVETDGRLCGRIFTRADGTVLTKDCPTGVARQRRKKASGVLAAAALLGGAAAALMPAEETCELEEPGIAAEAGDGVQPAPPAPVPPPIKSANPPGRMYAGKMMRSPVKKL